MNPNPTTDGTAEAATLLATVASSLDERLAVTAGELARSQALLREASEELLTAFRGAADRLVAAQKSNAADSADQYGVVLDHLYRAVQHLQSHDLVNQLIDAQKQRVEKMREKLQQALALESPGPGDLHAMLDCIIAGIRQIDDASRAPGSDKKAAGSVDLF